MKVKQAQLFEVKCRSSKMICWLDIDPRIHKGTKITFKDIPDILWEIEEIWDNVIVDHQSLHKPWRVGGLE